MNYLKYKRYIFNSLLKDVNSFIQYQLKTIRKIINKSYSLVKNLKIPNFSIIFKYINYKNFKLNNFYKILNIKEFRNFSLYLIGFIFISIIITLYF